MRRRNGVRYTKWFLKRKGCVDMSVLQGNLLKNQENLIPPYM